ncbi:MAG: hypothetical protein Q8P05_02905 [Candidatus Diapherotrites archaeon]|nr:hypothetical protein [Candidatus Diapherotrites archaeon]MDZ4256731.1 hypothetical protein [archaeon]
MNKHSNQRGVLFTFLTFLLVGVVISLVVFSVNVNQRTARNTIDISALNAINAKYDDITDDIITLDHPIGVPSIRQRIFPFTYTIDANRFHVDQTLPIATGKLGAYFDLIHAYRLFAMDKNVSRTYDGVDVMIDLPRPPAWGGTASTAQFNLLPQCIQYALRDDTMVWLESISQLGCSNTFSMKDQVERVDITLSLLSTVDDFNGVACSFDNTPQCRDDPYDPDSPFPYIHLSFQDSNCALCPPTYPLIIRGHFDPEFPNTIAYSCGDANCVSSPIIVQFSEGVRVTHAGTPIRLEMDMTFVQKIATFYYQDANYNVRKPGFDTYKSNAVVFPT